MFKLRCKRDQRVSILIQIAASQQHAGGSINPRNPLSLHTSQRCFLGWETQKKLPEMTACLPAPGGEMCVWTSADNHLGNSQLFLKAGWGCWEQAVSLLALVPAKRILFPVFIVDEVKLSKVFLNRMGKLPLFFILLLYVICVCEHMHVWRPKVDIR